MTYVRSPGAIKTEIEALAAALAAAEEHFARGQYRQITLDELDGCQSIDDIKDFLATALVPLMVSNYRREQE